LGSNPFGKNRRDAAVREGQAMSTVREFRTFVKNSVRGWFAENSGNGVHFRRRLPCKFCDSRPPVVVPSWASPVRRCRTDGDVCHG
jgi:hypothetical protein